ncbi:hypothetical protein VaNZ11_012568, partial [Volvox africanus]
MPTLEAGGDVATTITTTTTTTITSATTEVVEVDALVDELPAGTPATTAAAVVETISNDNALPSPPPLSATAAALDAAAAGATLTSLRLLQRIQTALVATLRGSRRVAPALAVKAPQLACHPALFLAGYAADRAVAGAQPPPLPPASGRGHRSQRQKQQPQQIRAQEHYAEKEVQQESLRVLMAEASKLAATTSSVVVLQLLQHGGSRVALATAAHLGHAVLQPHPELHPQLLLPLVHLLAFSTWAERVDARGLLSRRFEPHQALPTRAALCAWLERLNGPHKGPFLELLMCALLRAACGCRRGALPPGLIAVSMAEQDTADDAAVQTGTGTLSHNGSGEPAAGDAAVPRGPSTSCGEVTAAAHCPVWLDSGTATLVTERPGKSPQPRPGRPGPCL